MKRGKDEGVNGQGGKRGAPAPHGAIGLWVHHCYLVLLSPIVNMHFTNPHSIEVRVCSCGQKMCCLHCYVIRCGVRQDINRKNWNLIWWKRRVVLLCVAGMKLDCKHVIQFCLQVSERFAIIKRCAKRRRLWDLNQHQLKKKQTLCLLDIKQFINDYKFSLF